MNSRKGTHATTADVLDELTDVIITAAVAMSAVTGAAEEARRHFEQRLQTITARTTGP